MKGERPLRFDWSTTPFLYFYQQMVFSCTSHCVKRLRVVKMLSSDQILNFVQSAITANGRVLTTMREKKTFLQQNSQRLHQGGTYRANALTSLTKLWNEIFPTVIELPPHYAMLIGRYRVLSAKYTPLLTSALQAEIMRTIENLIHLIRSIHFLLLTIADACVVGNVAKMLFLESNALFLLICDIERKSETLQTQLQHILPKVEEAMSLESISSIQERAPPTSIDEKDDCARADEKGGASLKTE